jgi:hypothetical protein
MLCACIQKFSALNMSGLPVILTQFSMVFQPVQMKYPTLHLNITQSHPVNCLPTCHLRSSFHFIQYYMISAVKAASLNDTTVNQETELFEIVCETTVGTQQSVPADSGRTTVGSN